MTRRFSRSVTLLLELTAAIVIFALAAAVCVQVLISARDLSLQAQSLDRAVESVTSAAELLRAAENPQEAVELLSREPCLGLTFREDGGLMRYEISWIQDGRTLYSVELVRSGEVDP